MSTWVAVFAMPLRLKIGCRRPALFIVLASEPRPNPDFVSIFRKLRSSLRNEMVFGLVCRGWCFPICACHPVAEAMLYNLSLFVPILTQLPELVPTEPGREDCAGSRCRSWRRQSRGTKAILKPHDLAPAETAKDLAQHFGSKDNRSLRFFVDSSWILKIYDDYS